MRVYENKELSLIICNRCKKEIPVRNDVPREDSLFVEKRWNYFSDKDNEVHTFDLCEDCYDKMIADFLISPTEKR